jgi:hypothetical protein
MVSMRSIQRSSSARSSGVRTKALDALARTPVSWVKSPWALPRPTTSLPRRAPAWQVRQLADTTSMPSRLRKAVKLYGSMAFLPSRPGSGEAPAAPKALENTDHGTPQVT